MSTVTNWFEYFKFNHINKTRCFALLNLKKQSFAKWLVELSELIISDYSLLQLWNSTQFSSASLHFLTTIQSVKLPHRKPDSRLSPVMRILQHGPAAHHGSPAPTVECFRVCSVLLLWPKDFSFGMPSFGSTLPYSQIHFHGFIDFPYTKSTPSRRVFVNISNLYFPSFLFEDMIKLLSPLLSFSRMRCPDNLLCVKTGSQCVYCPHVHTVGPWPGVLIWIHVSVLS